MGGKGSACKYNKDRALEIQAEGSNNESRSKRERGDAHAGC